MIQLVLVNIVCEHLNALYIELSLKHNVACGAHFNEGITSSTCLAFHVVQPMEPWGSRGPSSRNN